MNTPIKLKVIEGIKIEKPDYFSLYSNAFIKTLEPAMQKYSTVKEYDKDTIKKLVWSGTKMVNTFDSRSNDKEGLLGKFSIITAVNTLMALLTPREFQNIFPIDKIYLDENDGWKDYFYTRKYIEAFGEDKVIGEEIENFLWEYQNWTISFYMVEKMGVISDLRKLETGKGIMEEFLEEQGVSTYTMHEGVNGKKFLENIQTGEVSEINKPKPKYLKLIK
ncbi:hypothetical protein ACTHOQ_13965 [Solibacillus silvestris]|uniref:hypothetical protein n=1 Tax=Solibacillus silvestris TaxID=76853 RepID=UPI003F7D1B2E